MLYILTQPALLGQDFWSHALPALSSQRREKVLNLRFARDRNLSAAAYLLLRLGLMEFGIPHAPDFTFETWGKPRLMGQGPQFSLSHCHEAVACALHSHAVGVDAESWTAFAPERMGERLLEQIFRPEEVARIAAAPHRGQAACDLWTERESAGKYTGLGLGDGLAPPPLPSEARVETHHLDCGVSVSLCRQAEPSAAPFPHRFITHEELSRIIENTKREQ